uniref:Uncharacterized protein n=1 Tax=Arundo donax TaxID=35708 RepID=A0A0A9BFJ2_ARUDO
MSMFLGNILPVSSEKIDLKKLLENVAYLTH